VPRAAYSVRSLPQALRRMPDRLIVHRGDLAYIILNAFPYSNGHLMVVPYRHTAAMEDYSDAEMLDVMRLTRLSLTLLRVAFKPMVSTWASTWDASQARASPDHLHWHIVPRWNGDTNFMPVLATCE